jgi:BASS family bile acid:Na+ symporter
VQELIHLAISAGLTLLVMAVGMQTSVADALHVLLRPALLLRSLIAIVIVVPLFALLVVMNFSLTHEVAVAIMLMAISPFPPFVPGTQLKLGGSRSYSFGLLLAVSLCSVITVPLSLMLLSRVFGVQVSVAPLVVAQMIFASVLAPMALGMLLHRFAPQWSERAAPWVSRLANLSVVIGLVPVLFVVWPAVMHLIGNGSVLAIAAVVLVGLLAGHLLGGPQPQDRAALAAAAATRHPGLAVLLAGAVSAEPNVKAAVLLFVIVGLLTEIPYQIWFKRGHGLAKVRRRQHE